MDHGDEILTCAQMRTLEQTAIASGTVTGLELMERAGKGVVDAVLARWPDMALTAQRAVILCGPGNNGGDGFVIARLLAARGWSVKVWHLGAADRLPPDAHANLIRWQAIGPVEPLPISGFYPPACDLLVDALFGTGSERWLDEFEELFENLVIVNMSARPARVPRIVAIDILSHVGADTGRTRLRGTDVYPSADLTVTFHTAKPGHFLQIGGEISGVVRVVDIGLWPFMTALPSDWEGDRVFTTRPDLQSLKKDWGHKYRHGHALVLAGGAGRGGAARLAARGALRVGAGVVTLACPHEALTENAARLEAVMLREVDTADTLAALLTDQRINALALGPGLGLGRARELVPMSLEARRATVLDADALTAFADTPGPLFAALHEGCVLTPHSGEFARLFPDLDLTNSLEATRAAAARAGCTVLLKGPATVIAAPDGRARINAAVHQDAAPWLATAGSGDVLAGIIAGLLARRFQPLDAAATGAWLHTAAARRFGPGLIADDLPEQIPGVFRDLGL